MTPAPNPLLRVPLSPENAAILRAFERSLRARSRSERTIQSYSEAALLLAGFLAPDGINLEDATRADVERFLIHTLENHSATTAGVRLRSLGPLYRWMVEEEYVEKSPIVGMEVPKAEEKIIPVISDDDLRKLVKACAGRDILDRRDEAIVRLFIDTGVRVSEMTGLQVDDLDMDADEATFHGKGRKVRRLPFGAKAGQALERYLRLRAKHPLAGTPGLWVGARGKALTPSGVTQMLERRADQAKIGHIHPHMFRHTAASFAAEQGMGDDAMMRAFGWSTREMLNRYGSATADERARRAMRKLSPGDRI